MSASSSFAIHASEDESHWRWGIFWWDILLVLFEFLLENFANILYEVVLIKSLLANATVMFHYRTPASLFHRKEEADGLHSEDRH